MTDRRTLWQTFIYTKERHLDLTWVIASVFVVLIAVGVICECTNHPLSVAAWGTLATVFSSALIAAVPISRARILANSQMPGQVAQAIAKTAIDANHPETWKTGDPQKGQI